MTEVEKIKAAVKYIALHLGEYNDIEALRETLSAYYYKLPIEADGLIVRSMILGLYNLACQVMAE